MIYNRAEVSTIYKNSIIRHSIPVNVIVNDILRFQMDIIKRLNTAFSWISTSSLSLVFGWRFICLVLRLTTCIFKCAQLFISTWKLFSCWGGSTR